VKGIYQQNRKGCIIVAQLALASMQQIFVVSRSQFTAARSL